MRPGLILKIMSVRISVIIPVYNEEKRINQTIGNLCSGNFNEKFEIIVPDGNPKGNTIKAIRDRRVIKILSPKGRGIQMNRGAQIAKGQILLFLHADTSIPFEGLKIISEKCKDGEIVGGAFDLNIDSPKKIFRIMEKISSIRSRITKIPYGDQAIFIKRENFFQIGGFKNIPLMEDVDLMRRVKNKGMKIIFPSCPVVTSARRWKKEGIVHATLRNWVILMLYFAGQSPSSLEKFYSPTVG